MSRHRREPDGWFWETLVLATATLFATVFIANLIIAPSGLTLFQLAERLYQLWRQ